MSTTINPSGPVTTNAPFPQGPAPKKKHTVRNLVVASIALVAVIGGCSAALAGGSGSDAAVEPAASAAAKPKADRPKADRPAAEAPARQARQARQVEDDPAAVGGRRGG